MSKFRKELTHANGNLRESRAKKVSRRVEMAQDELIRNIQKKIFNVESTIERLTDLGPDNSYSLRVVSENFEPDAWASDLQTAKTKLHMLNIELEIAKGTMKEWFEEASE